MVTLIIQQLDKIKAKRPEDLTIGEKIKRATYDDTFTWSHAYELMAAKVANWWDYFLLKLPNLVIGTIVFLLFILLAKVIGGLIYKIMKKTSKQESVRLIGVKIFKILFYMLGFIVFLIILDLNMLITSILGLAGVAGLAIGLAIQGVLNNTFSGLILSFLPKLQIGDWVETEGVEGTVAEISLRSVQILRPDNNLIMIPNSQILENPFINYSLTERVRISVNCGIAYNSNLEQVENLTKQMLSKVFKQNKGEEIEFFYQEFADSSINFLVRFWVNARNKKDELKYKHLAIIKIKTLFDEHGIEIPFPIRTLYMEK